MRCGSARAKVLVVMLLCLLILQGCSRPSVPSLDQSRTALPRTILDLLPESFEPLHHRGEADGSGNHLWILRSPEPVAEPDDLEMSEQEQIPSEIVLAQAMQYVADPDDLGTPTDESCQYLGWRDGGASYRLRQVNTDRGWLLWLEIYELQGEK